MTSPLADASLTANSPTVYTDISGLSALKRDAAAQSPETVRKVAQQFESIFAKMVLSSMRQANFGDSLFGSDQQQFYQGMFDDQLAVELTKGKGLGLADMLVQQLTRAGLVKGADGATGTCGAGTTAGSARVPAGGPFAAPSTSLVAPSTSRWQAGSPEEFVQQLWPCAEEAGKALGIDPKHLLAQAALETGWGKSLPCDPNGTPSFNFFGIKAGTTWQGDSVSVKTLEFEGGVPVPRQAKFRSYDSAADIFRDYVEVLRTNPRFAEALNTGSDAKAFANALQKGGYATDPRYAMKIETIAQNLGARAPISETALKSRDEPPMTSTTDVF
jgi:flagellar protein FlgJ